MALSYKSRRRLSLFLLLVWLPLFIFAAITVMDLIGRPPIWIELAVYVVLGVVWALPFRWAFKGVGKPDPDED